MIGGAFNISMSVATLGLYKMLASIGTGGGEKQGAPAVPNPAFGMAGGQ